MVKLSNVFTSVCEEFCPQSGVYVSQYSFGQTSPGRHPPDTPLGRHPVRHPLGGTHPWSDTPPGQTPPSTTGYSQQLGCMHPTGMHSCVDMFLLKGT